MKTPEQLRELVQRCLQKALRRGDATPPDDEDWIESGLLDSMALVDVLLCAEEAAGIPGFLDRQEGRPPRCTTDVISALQNSLREVSARSTSVKRTSLERPTNRTAVAGWGAALGALRVDAASVEEEFSLTPGKLTKRAGIQSVRRAGTREDEITLGAKAAYAALARSGTDASEVNFIVTTSETFLALPSLGSALHSQLLLEEHCGVLDVGGACTGLLSALSVGAALVAARSAAAVLIVTSDVHSRVLGPEQVEGVFGGLFGDGASAFVLRKTDNAKDQPGRSYTLGRFCFGCDGAHAGAIRLQLAADRTLKLEFDGEVLARAAVRRLARVIEDVEAANGVSRADAGGFALHQPNPRLVATIANEAGIPSEKIARVAETCGNLGSSTCGVALSLLLDQFGATTPRSPLFLAAVGPGMIWAGGLLY